MKYGKILFSGVAYKIHIFRKPRTLSMSNNIGSRNVVNPNFSRGDTQTSFFYESLFVLHGRTARTTSQKPTTTLLTYKKAQLSLTNPRDEV